jgi:DNA-binding transcriptional ArsR family regulator
MDDPTNIFHELGDPTRLRVLLSIIDRRKNVSTIVSELGLSQPRVSYHLRRLKDAGLAVEEKDGRWVWYQAHHGSDEAHLRELLDLMSRWAGSSGTSGSVGSRRIEAANGGSGRRHNGAGAGVMRGGRKIQVPRAQRHGVDDEGRPVVDRPKKPADDMEDFML